jgi:ABC-type cobalamin/Fe3+-siderophores transport system ATPase subunit
MLEFKNLDFGYNTPLLQNINLTFPKGKITTIIGPNGCGKSTLLKLGAKLLKPQKGVIELNNQNINSFRSKEYARQVSILLQSTNIPQITVNSLVGHGRFPYLSYHKQHTKTDKEIIAAAMETAGVSHLKYQNINRLSGGERQRAFIAMALAQDTDLLMLDEPTTYLDINHQLEIMNLVKKLNGQGKTIIMVLHDLNLALHNSHLIILMNKGQIVEMGTPQEVVSSKKIDQIFNITTTPVMMDNKTFYIFRDKNTI